MSMGQILHDALANVAASASAEPNVGDLIGRFDHRVRQRRTRRIALGAGSIVMTVALVLTAAGKSRANNAVQVDRPQNGHGTTTTLDRKAVAPARRSADRSTTTTTAASSRGRSTTVGTSPAAQVPSVQLPLDPQIPSDSGATPTTIAIDQREPGPTTTSTTTVAPSPPGEYIAWATGFHTATTSEATYADANSCNALSGGAGAATGAPDGNPWAYSASVFPGCTASQEQMIVADFSYLHCANVSAISSFEFVIATTSGQIATANLQFKLISGLEMGSSTWNSSTSMPFPAGANTDVLGPYSGGFEGFMVGGTSAVTILSFNPGVSMAIDAIGIRYHGDVSSCTHP